MHQAVIVSHLLHKTWALRKELASQRADAGDMKVRSHKAALSPMEELETCFIQDFRIDRSFTTACFLTLYFFNKSVYCVHPSTVTPLHIECLSVCVGCFGEDVGTGEITGLYCTDPQGKRHSGKTCICFKDMGSWT